MRPIVRLPLDEAGRYFVAPQNVSGVRRVVLLCLIVRVRVNCLLCFSKLITHRIPYLWRRYLFMPNKEILITNSPPKLVKNKILFCDNS